jgi:hypothetical protein
MNTFSNTVTENTTSIITTITTNDNNNNNNNNGCVSSAVVSASLSERCGAPSGCNGEDGVQVKKVAVNVLNKQQQTSDKGCPTVWWLGELLTS